MRDVADVTGDESVDPVWRAGLHQQDEPVHEHEQRDHDADQERPDVVRDRQEEAEEDGQARAAQIVVGDDDPDGVRVRAHGPRAYASSSSGTTRFQRSEPTMRKRAMKPMTTFSIVTAMYMPMLKLSSSVPAMPVPARSKT